MTVRPAGFERLIALALALAATAACASAPRAGAVAPSPFPGAPRPPATRAGVAASGGLAGAPVTGDALVQTALGLLGVAYRYGGDDPATGLDCSGLIRWVFDQYGIDMPRTVEEQFDAGRPIDVRQLEAGDLIFFTTTGPGATHVGIALGAAGPGEFVHAPSTNGVVRIERYDASYWRDRIVGYRRVVPVSVSPPSAPG